MNILNISLHTPTSKALLTMAVLAGTMGVGNLRLTDEPSISTVALSCIEFANADDQSVFNSTGLIRAGSKISNKTGGECTGGSTSETVKETGR